MALNSDSTRTQKANEILFVFTGKEGRNMGELDISEATVKLSGRNIHHSDIVSYDVNIFAHADGGPNAHVSVTTIIPRQADEETTRQHAISEAKRLAIQFIQLPPERFKSA